MSARKGVHGKSFIFFLLIGDRSKSGVNLIPFAFVLGSYFVRLLERIFLGVFFIFFSLFVSNLGTLFAVEQDIFFFSKVSLVYVNRGC